MNSNRRFLVVIAGAFVIMGCGSTDVTSPPVSVAAGTYIMTRVNGSALPTNISDDRSPVWINSGSLTIESSGSFKSEVTYDLLSGESFVSTTDTCAGTYSRNSKGFGFFGSDSLQRSYFGNGGWGSSHRTGEPVDQGRVQDVDCGNSGHALIASPEESRGLGRQHTIDRIAA